MKLPFLLCFLALVSSSAARGEPATDAPGPEDDVSVDQGHNKATVSPNNGDYNPNQTGTSRLLTTQQTLNGTENEASNSTSLGLTPSPSTPPTTPAITMSTEDLKPTSASGSGDKKIKVTSAPTTTSAASAGGSSKAGLAVLVLIILIIIILCIILLRLRRASRTHSFDLQGFGPSRRLDEPTGTFGRVYVDDLGRHAPKDVETTEELTTTPAANGTSPEPVEKGPSEENGTSVVPREQPGTSEVQNSPCSSFGSSLEDERARTTSVKLSSNNLFLDAAEEQQQNENNNNPAVGSSSPFVEIDLDEPAWCDQLLTSPPPSSSVCSSSSS